MKLKGRLKGSFSRPLFKWNVTLLPLQMKEQPIWQHTCWASTNTVGQNGRCRCWAACPHNLASGSIRHPLLISISSMDAAALKARGNAQFAAGDYAAAQASYSEAIRALDAQADPQGLHLIYGNRRAVLLCSGCSSSLPAWPATAWSTALLITSLVGAHALHGWAETLAESAATCHPTLQATMRWPPTWLN